MNDDLKKLYIHKNVTEIRENHFQSRTWIEVEDENTVYRSEEGSLYSKDGTSVYHEYNASGESLRDGLIFGFMELGI